MSMTPIEETIVNLRDAGLSYDEIAQHGFTANTVRFTLSKFGCYEADLKEISRDERRMTNGSKALLAAIQQALA